MAVAAAEPYDRVSPEWFGGGMPANAIGPVESPTVAPLDGKEWIVRLTPEGAAAAGNVAGSNSVLGSLGFSYQVVRGLGLPGQLLVRTFDADEQLARSAFAAHPAVAYAGQNEAIIGSVTNPNDLYYTQGRLFGLNLTSASGVGNPGAPDADIDAPEAWDITQGSAGIVVAVLDSGIDYTHADLAPNIWTDPLTGNHGYDFFSGDADPMDENSHGTHVAGIIGAKGNNGQDVTGVNWNTSLMSVRVLGPNNSGDVAKAVEGINYITGLTQRAINPVNVRVINASWAINGQFVSSAVKASLVDAIRAAGAEEIVVVAAAGNGDILNNGVDLNSAVYLPAAIEREQAVTLENLIVVAASDPFDRITSFSNYGATVVDLAAPGDDIYSTLPGNETGFRDGTSMAAPFVAGVAALVASHRPELTAAEIKEAILKGVDPLATPEDRAKVASGGRLNAYGALTYNSFAPRVTLQSASDIFEQGAVTHEVTLRYTGRTPINTTTLGLDDIVVRKGVNGEPLTIQGVSFTSVDGNPNIIDATYTIAGPADGFWNGPDNGSYQIEVVAESVKDATRSVEGRVFDGADGFAVDIDDGVFRVVRSDDTSGVGLSLRDAILQANTHPGAVILLPAGTYVLSQLQGAEDADFGDLDITGQITVASDGSGPVIISANGIDRVFDVHAGASLTLQGLTVRGGNTSGDGGGVRSLGALTVIDSDIRENLSGANGGGIYSSGSLTLNRTRVSDNTAVLYGAGVYNAASGAANVTDSEIEGNQASGFHSKQLATIGNRQLVNTTTAGYQYQTRIGMNAAGQSVAVWGHFFNADRSEIYAQRFDASGTPVGGQITIEGFADPNAWYADVAVAPDGSFAVAYQIRAAGDPNVWNARVKFYNALAELVSTVTPHTWLHGEQFTPELAVDSAGNYTVVWQDGSNFEGHWVEIFARRYSNDGTSLSEPAVIPQTRPKNQELYDVAQFENQESVVVWTHPRSDDSGRDVFYRFVGPAGTPLANEVRVNTHQTGDQLDAFVAASEDGFVVTWRDPSRGVIARMFGRNGVPISGDIVVVSSTARLFPNAAMLADGAFAIAWSQPSASDPTIGYDVFVQAFAADGTPYDQPKKANSTLASFLHQPWIASDGDGTVAVVWEGSELAADRAGIYMQRFDFVALEGGGQGGGVYNAGSLTLSNSTIADNEADDHGGGVFNSGSIVATNLTLSGNSSQTWGGGLYNDDAATSQLLSSTVTANADHGMENNGGGIALSSTGAVTLGNTIVAANISAGGVDVKGHFTSLGGNVIGVVGSATGLTHATDQVGMSVNPIDPLLGPLANNGGLTRTHLPSAESPAIDAGSGAGPSKDQRGAPRVIDGDDNGAAVIDSGAVEFYYASISGKLFHDSSGAVGNGLQNPGEQGLAGWTIFIDLNNNGRLDSFEPSTTTDADNPVTPGVDEAGQYRFISLPPGNYTVAVQSQPGWERTYVSTSLVQQVTDSSQAIDGLDGANAIATTGDGRLVFVAGADPAEAKISRFLRNPSTGELAFLGVTTSSQTIPNAGGANVLASVNQLAIGTSASGTFLYALSPNGAITVFSVDVATGQLTLSEVLRDGATHGTLIQGLTGAAGMAVSPDGSRVYVSNGGPTAPNGGALFIFERSGASLLHRRRLANSASVFGAGGEGVAVSPDGNFIFIAGKTAEGLASVSVFERSIAGGQWANYRSILVNSNDDSAGNLVSSLDGARGIAVSPDGKFVYVTATGSGGVTAFEFNPTSKTINLLQTLLDGEVDYQGNQLRGLQQASAMAMSADGGRLYVAGKEVDLSDPVNPIVLGALVVFERDPITGRLAFIERRIDGEADGSNNAAEYLDVVTALAAPDDQFVYIASSDYEDALSVFRRDTRGSEFATLVVGQSFVGLNLSIRAQPGSIHGVVYENRNGNQQRDVDEPPLVGWEVYLDLNNNGVWDLQPGGAAEPQVRTDATGAYAFQAVAAGQQYAVRLRPRSGWSITAPSSPTLGFYQVAVAPGESVLRRDFGATLTSIIGAGLGTLRGVVFEDADGDGVQAAVGEPGLPNLRVFLDLDDDGVVDGNEPIALTSPSGSVGEYTFAGVPEATFTIRIHPADLAARQIVAPIGNALSQQTYALGGSINPSRIATADFDADGDADLAVLTLDGIVTIFRNDGAGQFNSTLKLPTWHGATSMAAGDFNGDGRPDIALASSTNSKLAIGMNKQLPAGQLAFDAYRENVSVSLRSWDLIAANLDGDARAEIVIAQRAASPTTASQLLVLRSTFTGQTPSFATQSVVVGKQPRAIAAAQVNGAGGLDLVVVNQLDRTVQILINTGGSFTSGGLPIPIPVGSVVDAPISVAAGDFNGDNKIDVLVGNSHTSILTLLLSQNNSIYGLGGYTQYSQKALDARGLPRDLVTADIDDDGDLDIVVGTVGPAGVTILRNTGGSDSPRFSEPEVKGVAALNAADLPGVKSLVVGNFKNDGGLPDIAAVAGQIDAGSLLLYANSPAIGAHRAAAAGLLDDLDFAVTSAPVGGDFNGDGRIDGTDFLLWQRTFGAAAIPPGSGADGNGNGVVDAADLTMWKNSFGHTTVAASSTAAILAEEPSTVQVLAEAPYKSASGAAYLFEAGVFLRADLHDTTPAPVRSPFRQPPAQQRTRQATTASHRMDAQPIASITSIDASRLLDAQPAGQFAVAADAFFESLATDDSKGIRPTGLRLRSRSI